MNVSTMAMDPDVAREKLTAYLSDKHADSKEAYDQCAKGYLALAEGKTLVHLDAAIRGGGFFPSGLPKLAVARADRKAVCFRWEPNDTVARYDARALKNHYGRGNPGTLMRRIDMQRHHGVRYGGSDNQTYGRYLEGWSQVPLVPADVRPATGQLKNWFVLWEVQRWFDNPRRIDPDRDPMLLEHVAGQLYALLAEWELTDLERAVLAGALQPEATE